MIGRYRWELHSGDNLNLDIGRRVTCGVGRNIFLYGSKEAAQKMRKSHRGPETVVTGDVIRPN